MLLRFFAHRWSLVTLTLLAMLMVAPTLNVGLIGDDYIHRGLILGLASHAHTAGSFFDLFTFVDGEPAHIQALKDAGRVTWWAADKLRLSFWRPLTELTQWLDYALWPDTPALMHAQNIAWYGLLVYLVGRLYRQLDPQPLHHGLATFIYAASSLHLFTVAWLAARNQLVAACFTVLTITAYHQWRQGGSGWQGLWALLSLALGLLSAEAAVATMGYLVAYALAVEQGRPLWPRLRALLPFFVAIVVWRVVYSHLGHGSQGSGAYIDPGANLPRFAQALLMRLPTLLMAQLYGASSSVFNQLPMSTQLFYASGAAASVAAFMAVARYFGLWSTPLARFFGLGALLALVPVCAAEPNDRLLLNAELGMSALFALLLVKVAAQRKQYTGLAAIAGKTLVGLIAVVHLLLFPVITLVSAAVMKQVTLPTAMDEPLSIPDARAQPSARVVLLNPPGALFVYYYPVVRQYFGVANPVSMQALASGNQPLTLRVIDDSTIELSGPKGFVDAMSRDIVKYPFHKGDQVRAGAVQVTVMATSDKGVPTTARFHFATPLRDADWRFYTWGDKGHTPFTMPAPGQTVTLPAVDLGKMVMKRLKGN